MQADAKAGNSMLQSGTPPRTHQLSPTGAASQHLQHPQSPLTCSTSAISSRVCFVRFELLASTKSGAQPSSFSCLATDAACALP